MRQRFRLAALVAIAMGMLLSASAQAMQCVTYAREQSGIGLKGDAWTWWVSAAGRYERGQKPRVGAVVVFRKHGSMRHGHVAVVSGILSARKVLVDHANWAPHRGRDRGRVTTRVVMMDVSPHNDWSRVRVWNEAAAEMGQRVYPTYGFIYPKAGRATPEEAKADLRARPAIDLPSTVPEPTVAADSLGDGAILPGMSSPVTSAAASRLLLPEFGVAQ